MQLATRDNGTNLIYFTATQVTFWCIAPFALRSVSLEQKQPATQVHPAADVEPPS
jgi:hypothetical protein